MSVQATSVALEKELEEDVWAFSWVDETFFVLRKAVTRSCKCYSQLAAGSTLHDVIGGCGLVCLAAPG